MEMKLVLLLATFFRFNYVHSETASFFGASYITVPLEEAKSTTQISFKFLTKRADALLFLAAGETDFCLIKLESGRLKVHINLGAGESVISSPHGLNLNDLQWHQISITRKDANLTLAIDQIFTTHEKLPGRFFELNIRYGLFVGGKGEFVDLFLGHADLLRGCISDLTYNGVSPLQRARQRTGSAEAHGILWTCAKEFQASAQSEISFIDSGAFMALPNKIPRKGTRWDFELKTGEEDGVLLYATGGGENSDFVGVEIVNGFIRVTLDKGGGPTEVNGDIRISDGLWHNVTVNFNPTLVQLIVDNNNITSSLIQTTNRYFDLGDMMYVGGIELNKRARALGQGLKTADSSLKGCIRSILVSLQLIGLPEAKVTQGILPTCVWGYPCYQNNPCISNATCVHKSVASFVCLCDKPRCVKQDIFDPHKDHEKTMELQLVEVSPVSVFEGQNVLFSTSNINVVLDYARYGIKDSGVVFYTNPAAPPRKGHMVIEVWEKPGTPQSFSLLDLAKDKVRYVHDGTESENDNIVLEVEFSPGNSFTPPHLKGRHRFILNVNVTPVNDPPTLNIPSNRVLKLAQGTRKVISPNLLNATDPDSPRSELTYSVSGEGLGSVEKLGHPGVSLASFTQSDVDLGLIVYSHNGSSIGNSKLMLQVSDGAVSSPTASLRVVINPLLVQLVNNTGALLTHQSSVILTSSNLSFVTNADDPSVQIVYKVVEPCEFGTIERGHDLGGKMSWQSVREFTSSHLSQGLLRYRHTAGRPGQDMFKFKVTAEGIDFSPIYDFRLTFTDLKLVLSRLSPANLNSTSYIFLSNENIQYITSPLNADPNKIIYTLTKLPRFGSLFRTEYDDSRILLGDNFTQADINEKKVKYKMLRTAYVPLNDDVSVKISTLHCDRQPQKTIKFIYVPPKDLPHKVKTTLNTIKAMEGGTTPVLPSDLLIQVTSVKSLVYEVARSPQHGVLKLIDPIQNRTEENITQFTPSQISSRRLMYSHDGSETTKDSLLFIAISNIEDDFMTVGVLNVTITLVNDNAPVRVVSSVFRVVSGGQRLLTTRHIKFKDDDTDFDESNLLYIVKNGTGIFSVNTKQPLLQFTQGDLDAEKVLIVENRQGGNQILFWVSDGTHTTECTLDVRPSPSYIEITNNSHLVVSQGGQATITSSNLYSDTNINIRPQDIKYDILSGPSHGVILISGLSSLTSFTQGEIENGLVVYKHLSTGVAQDRIQLRVAVENISAEGWLAVRVFPPAYWEPLVVFTNKTLHVEEATSVSITGQFLQVKQSGVPPSDITYLVVSAPRGGYLEIEGNEEERAGDEEEKGGVHAFDQATVDAGKLHYIQVSANMTSDRVIVDVTNGISWLRSLTINFVVIPSKLFLSSEELVVEEGGSIVLPPSGLASLTPYYARKITDYYITELPKHGTIVISPSNKSTNKWSLQQMNDSLVKYIHDDTETTKDKFVVVGRAGDKESIPVSVNVKISPVNDMSPKIVNNSELTIWRGGSQFVTSNYLSAIDEDTPPDNVSFAIISASKGFVAKSVNNRTVVTFTQREVNRGEILLVHNGEKGKVEIEVVITDGVHKVGPISIVALVVEPILKLDINEGLHVFPLLRKPITQNLLSASCSDQNRVIHYRIKIPPKKGRLLMNEGKDVVTNFTQNDINENRVYYQHSTPFKESSSNDSFVFDVLGNFVQPLLNNVFFVDISVFSGGLEQLLDLTSLTIPLDEGENSPLHLNTSNILKFLSERVEIEKPVIHGMLSLPPQHGNLCIGDDCNVTTFNHTQLQSGVVIYQHDHSDTLSDLMQISLYLDPGDVLLCNVTLHVSIRPINDQPFKLVTDSPRITVVQGQEVFITKNELYTEDLDTIPGEIIYDIISGPSLGSVMMGNSTVGRFTQEDINNNIVFYRHRGALQATSFYFRVWDGQFSPHYTVFNIGVVKITLNASVVLPLSLEQGSSVARISEDIFSVVTNAKKDSLVYNVTTLPRHGVVYAYDFPKLQFTHRELLSGNVVYIQNDMSTPSDAFELSVHTAVRDGPVVSGLWVNVSVEPLVTYGSFFPSSGSKTKLDTRVLDASHLASLTNSNPAYRILKRPRHGRIKKIIVSSLERKVTREKEVSRFTHEELQNGVIYYVGRKSLETVEDRFPFLLTASTFQPAIGELRFEVTGESPSTTFKPPKPRLPGPKSPIGHDGVQMASPNMSDDYLLGVSMVTGVIALALLIVGFVKCGAKNTEEESNLKPDLPDPLPQPPDDLLPSSPLLTKRNTPILTPVALPQCKMLGDSITSSEPELNLRYPYGDEDWTSYDTTDISFQTKTSNNPMLRKNQYWV